MTGTYFGVRSGGLFTAACLPVGGDLSLECPLCSQATIGGNYFQGTSPPTGSSASQLWLSAEHSHPAAGGLTYQSQTCTTYLAVGRAAVASEETQETTLWPQGRGDPQGTLSQSVLELRFLGRAHRERQAIAHPGCD